MAATEGMLGSLHEKLAQHFIRVLDEYDKQRMEFEQRQSQPAASNPDDPFGDMEEPVLDLAAGLSPALLGVMIKFLKDNDITANPDAEGSSVAQLRDTLKKRRKAGNVEHVEFG